MTVSSKHKRIKFLKKRDGGPHAERKKFVRILLINIVNNNIMYFVDSI